MKLPEMDEDHERCADSVAKALLRDVLESQESIGRKLDDIESRLVARARRLGMPEAEIRELLNQKPS